MTGASGVAPAAPHGEGDDGGGEDGNDAVNHDDGLSSRVPPEA